MHVGNVMTKQVECVLADATLVDAARKMKERDVGTIPVVDDGEPVGVVTDRDLVVRGLASGEDARSTPVRNVMTRDTLWCEVSDDVESAAKKMEQHGVRRLLVRADGRLAGIVSLGDLAARTEEAPAGRVLSTICES